mgnify:FL=1
MYFGESKQKRKGRKLRKIRKGWHDWYAWFPASLEDGRVAWFETVERKFYVASPSAVVKRGLNENKLNHWQNLDVMYRSKGSNAEKTVYYKRNGTLYADAGEIVDNLSKEFFDKLS